MEKDFVREIGKKILKAIKVAFRPILIIIGLIVAIIIILTSAVYFVTVDDGTYKEDDWSSPGFGVAQNTKTASVDLSSGKLSTQNTAQELWDKMVKEGSRVDEYLSGPEELIKLMNAEIITQYPDTRANPDEEINWDEVLKTDANELQGIIKLKRNLTTGTTILNSSDVEDMQADYEIYKDEYQLKKEQEQKEKEEQQEDSQDEENDEEIDITKGMLSFDEWMKNKGYTQNDYGDWTRPGSSIRMTYVTPEEFESYVQEYRNTGSEAAKQKALSHFTLEKANAPGNNPVAETVDSFYRMLFIGDSNTTRLQSDTYISEENRNKIITSTFKGEEGAGPQYWLDNIDSLPRRFNC